MVSKSMFSVEEWSILRDAPEWVNAVLASAENNLALDNKIKETMGFKKAVSKYQGGSVLIREVLADTTAPSKEIKGAKMAKTLEALSKINSILEQKNIEPEEADKFRDFLMEVANSVAESASEGLLGLGQKVSKKEADAIAQMEVALKASPADKKARAEAVAKAKAAADAKVRADAAAKAKAEMDAKAKAAADAKAKAEAEAKAAEEARIKAEVDAKVKAELKAKADAEAGAKARAEIEAKIAEQKAQAAAKAKAAEEAAKAKAEVEAAAAKAKAEAEAAAAKAKAEAEVAAAKAAAEAAKPKFLAEHTVVSGESLSLLSKKYYGSIAQDKWMLIYEANKAIIGDNPNLIRVGQVLKIPVLPS